MVQPTRRQARCCNGCCCSPLAKSIIGVIGESPRTLSIYLSIYPLAMSICLLLPCNFFLLFLFLQIYFDFSLSMCFSISHFPPHHYSTSLPSLFYLCRYRSLYLSSYSLSINLSIYLTQLHLIDGISFL